MQEFFQIKRDLLKLSYKQENVTDGQTDRQMEPITISPFRYAGG